MDTFKANNNVKVIPQPGLINVRSRVIQEVDNEDISPKLQVFYQERLADTMKLLYQKIINDELITTLSENQTSSEFIEERIKEIIENKLLYEKEQIISKIVSDNEQLQQRIEFLELDNQTLASSIQSVHNQMTNLNYDANLKSLEEKIKKNVNELHDKDVKIEQLIEKLEKYEQLLMEKSKEYQKQELEKQRVELLLETERNKMTFVDKFQEGEVVEKKNLKLKHEEAIEKYDKLNEEYTSIRLKYEQIGLERINEQEQYKLLIDQIKVKCKDKTHNLKIKYKQYKDMSRSLQEKLIQNDGEVSEKLLQINDLKVKLSDSNRSIIDYQRQISDHQREMKQVIEQLQLQTDEVDRLKKLQQETIDTLQDKIEFNEKSLRNNLEESQQIITNQQKDISLKNRQITELSQKLTQSIADHSKQLQQLANEADAQREDIQQELIQNSNALEGEILDLKNTLTRLQKESEVLHEENKKLFLDTHSRQSKIKEFEVQVQQNQQKINDLESKLNAANQLSSDLDEQNRQLDAQNQQFFNDNKSLIAQTEEQEKIILNLKQYEAQTIQFQEAQRQLEQERNTLLQQLTSIRSEHEKYKNEVIEFSKESEKEKRVTIEGQMRIKENEVSLKIEVERLQSELKHSQLLFEEKCLTKQKEMEVIQNQHENTLAEKIKCLETLSEITKKYESLKEKTKELQENKEQLTLKCQRYEISIEEKQSILEKNAIQIDQIQQESQQIKEQFNQKLRSIALHEENIAQHAKENQGLNKDLKDLLLEKNNVERKLESEIQLKNKEIQTLQQQLQTVTKQMQFEAQQRDLQVEREKIHLEAKIDSLDKRCKEYEQAILQKEEEQEDFVESLTEKEALINEQQTLITNVKQQMQQDSESMKAEIKRLSDTLKQKEKQYLNFTEQQKEFSKDKLKQILLQLDQSKQQLLMLQQTCTSEINDTHRVALQNFQNILQFNRGQQQKQKAYQENDMEKYQENISTKFEILLEKERAVMIEKETTLIRQVQLLEQKVAEISMKLQEEKQIAQREQNEIEEKHIAEKIQLNNEIITLKNQLLKIESKTARSIERNQKQMQQIHSNAQKNQAILNSQLQEMKSKIVESEKKEIEQLKETRSKIHHMKSHLQSIEHEDANEFMIQSSSSSSSVSKNNATFPKKNSIGENNRIQANIFEGFKKDMTTTIKAHSKDLSSRSSQNASTLNPSHSQTLFPQRSQSKSKIKNFYDGINYTLGSSSSKHQGSPQKGLSSSKNSMNNLSSNSCRNRSSTNHQGQSVDAMLKKEESQRQKNSSVSNLYGEQLKAHISITSQKKQPSKEEFKQASHRSVVNPSIFSQAKGDKLQNQIFSTAGSQYQINNNNTSNNIPFAQQQQDQNASDIYPSPYKNIENNSNTFIYSPDTVSKQPQQINAENSYHHQLLSVRDKQRSNTPTYLSTLAEKSLQELKLEIVKQKQRLTLSKNNSQDIPSPMNFKSSSNITSFNEQSNNQQQQFLLQNKYNNNQISNRSQNDNEGNSLNTYSNPLSVNSQQQSLPVRKNLMNYNHYKFASPSPNKILLQQQQKLLQSQSQPQSLSSKSKQGQPLDIQDL